jgi:hypothetical protein
MCFRFATRTIAAATLLGAMLGCCSEYYFDRRDTVSLHSGEAQAANRVTMMIDPWPAASGQRNIAYNGEKAATASERYRTGRIIPPGCPSRGSAAGAIHGQQSGCVGAGQRAQRQQINSQAGPEKNNANGQVFERDE